MTNNLSDRDPAYFENKKVIRAWCIYDWANSVYSLTITTAIFPAYYESVTSASGTDRVNFFGLSLINTELYSYALSFSFFFVALILPLLTGIADYSGKKKWFLRGFAYLGAVACLGLFFFNGQNVEWGIFCSVAACIGYSGSLVFYDSFLPEIVSYDRFDKVSAQGYSYGYIGSVILLIINLAMVQMPAMFGLEDGGMAARISFLTVGIWWVGFSQIPFYYLRDSKVSITERPNIISKGYKEIRGVWNQLQSMPETKKFLVAFFFYNMGVQTVMYLAILFGSKELNLETGDLIISVLVIQLVAIGGAYLFARISEVRGNVFSLQIMILIWIGICVFAFYTYHAWQFYTIAMIVGLVMGGIQSLSRATYAKLIPQNTRDTASFFSFYDVLFNLSIGLGAFCYGMIERLTGTMRNSTLALGIFFIIGFVLISGVLVQKKIIRKQ